MASESRGLSFDTDTWRKLQEWAAQEGRSLSNAAERLILLQLAMQAPNGLQQEEK